MQDQNPQNSGPNGLFSRLPKPSLRQRRLIAMGTAAGVVVIGLGAFALLPPVQAVRTAGEPVMLAANDFRTAARARACWRTVRRSASPIWWSG